MKTVAIKEASMDACVNDAQRERVVVTRDGKPVALIIGIKGLDAEQVELGTSDAFWNFITERRQQKTLSRANLEREISKKLKDGNNE